MNSGSIILKSLAIAAVAGLGVLGIFYGFFTSHRELGIEPSSARWAGIAVFFLGFIISWIYYQMRARR